jgi:hypothetical protein
LSLNNLPDREAIERLVVKMKKEPDDPTLFHFWNWRSRRDSNPRPPT